MTNPRVDGPSAGAILRVMKRDRFRCTYCGISGSDAELQVDHITPVARGGSHHIANLTTACRACNQSKGTGEAPKTRPSATQASDGAQRTGGVVGLWVHKTYGDGDDVEKRGLVNWQGLVVGIEGEYALVQLFSWWMGEPTNVIAVLLKDILTGGQWNLYADKEIWLAAATESTKRTIAIDEQRRQPLTGAEAKKYWDELETDDQ